MASTAELADFEVGPGVGSGVVEPMESGIGLTGGVADEAKFGSTGVV